MKSITVTRLMFFALVLAYCTPASAYCRASSCESVENYPCIADEQGCLLMGLPLGFELGTVLQLDVATEDEITPTEKSLLLSILTEASLIWLAGEYSCDTGGLNLFLDQDDCVIGADMEGEGDGGAGGNSGAVTCPLPEEHSSSSLEAPRGTVSIHYHRELWPFAAAALGRTVLDYQIDTGVIRFAEIHVNGLLLPLDEALVSNDARAQLLGMVTHEWGHVIGLDHSREGGSVMRPVVDPAEFHELHDLGQDDIDGVCALYPPQASVHYFDFTPAEIAGSDPKKDRFFDCSVADVGGATQPRPVTILIFLMILGTASLARRKLFRHF